jgi:hypothetical protein
MHPGRSALLAAWWLLREIEALQARRKHSVIDFQQKKVTWRLPSSKADWKALGAERARKCCCAFSTRDLCPFHAMVEHLSNLAEDPEAPCLPNVIRQPSRVGRYMSGHCTDTGTGADTPPTGQDATQVIAPE